MTVMNDAKVLAIRCQLEALISEREGMLAENARRASGKQLPAHGKFAFELNAAGIRDLIPELQDAST